MNITWLPEWRIAHIPADERAEIYLISIMSEPDTWPDPTGFAGVHQLAFHDYTTVGRDAATMRGFDRDELSRIYPLLSDEQARAVWEFVVALPEDARLYVHCEAGISRSAGMAAAIALMDGQDPREMFVRAFPNIDVMGKMLSNYPNRQWIETYRKRR